MVVTTNEDDEHLSDDDVPDNVHNRLLGVISNLYKQKRVKAPIRKESSYKVSEFHLTKDKKKGKINLRELTKGLDKRAGHNKINFQINQAKQTSRRLPKPLETPEVDKIQRNVGYENMKRDLNRWDAVVYHQRAAEQVNYPLTVPDVHMHNTSNDFLTTFKTPTELELKLAESINSELKLRQEIKEKSAEEANFPLSLEEIKERRSIMARLRAQLSHREAKAARQNRIKSKKFHRIQRRDKVKQQIKEFEELQKTDPEAALKKLEQLEKARAQERASLRHRTTGQWARNLAVRAKYNKDARIALSEQLSQSRNLTQKVGTNGSDAEDNLEDSTDDDDENKTDKKSPDNSWLNSEQTSEVQEYYNKYKTYADENRKNGHTPFVTVIENEDVIIRRDMPSNENNNNETGDLRINNKTVQKCHDDVQPSETIELNAKNIEVHSTTFLVTEKAQCIPANSNDVKNKKHNDFRAVTSVSSNAMLNITKNNHQKKGPKEMKNKLCRTVGSWLISSSKHDKETDICVQSSKKNKRCTTGSICDKKSFNVTETDKQKINPSLLNFDDMFYEVEERLNEKCLKRIKRFQEISNTNVDIQMDSNNLDDNDDTASLVMKQQKQRINLDEELNETVSSRDDTSLQTPVIEIASALSKSKNTSNSKQAGNIKPDIFFHAKPKKLNTAVPKSFEDAEENLDDTENAERSMTVSEAFACDDVDEAFQHEKEEEIKKSKIEDVNTILPGWGSWGGPDIKTQPKRKKRRFITRFPKVLPRRDENKGNVVINEDKDETIKPHLVTELPFPFTQVKEYEASIRAPIGSTFLPESAHRKLIVPSVSTKLGTIIEPMTKHHRLQSKENWK